MEIKYIIIICIDRASKDKKVCLQRSAQSFPKKITIMKRSKIYPDFCYKIHQKWPPELGMKICKRRKCFHTLLLEMFQVWWKINKQN